MTFNAGSFCTAKLWGFFGILSPTTEGVHPIHSQCRSQVWIIMRAGGRKDARLKNGQ